MTDKEYTAGEVTAEQKMLAAPILDEFPNMCLMTGHHRGQEVAFVCQVENGVQDEVLLYPRFIVVTDDMMQECVDCMGRETEMLDV